MFVTERLCLSETVDFCQGQFLSANRQSVSAIDMLDSMYMLDDDDDDFFQMDYV